MTDEHSTPLKPYWQIIDIIGKLAIPVVLGFMTWTVSRAQHQLAVKNAELQQAEIQASEELKVLEIFYKELLSHDPSRKRLACIIVKMHGRKDLLERLAIAEPELGLWLSVDISQNRLESNEVRSEAQRIRYNIADKLRISRPVDGDVVEMFTEIFATTPFASMKHHYIVVTPYRTKADIVESEAPVSDGLIRARVKLGDSGGGGGDKFALRIVATNSELSIGEALGLLDDSISSNSVTVVRASEVRP